MTLAAASVLPGGLVRRSHTANSPMPSDRFSPDLADEMSSPASSPLPNGAPLFKQHKSFVNHQERIELEVKEQKENACYTWRQFQVSCGFIYGLLAWLQFVSGRALLLGEVGINLLVAYTFFKRDQAAYCSCLAVTIAAPYFLLWNAILKQIYKDFYADFRPKNLKPWQVLLITMYLFQPLGTFFIFIYDIYYMLQILWQKTMIVCSGLSSIDKSSFEIESARGITHVLFEGIPKSLLFLYVLFIASDRNEAIDSRDTYVVYIGLGLGFLNLVRNIARIYWEAKKESIGIVRYIIFRLQLVEISFPAYLPLMAAIYQDKLEVVNYSDVVLSSESSNQLAAAVQSSEKLKTLRFSMKTIRNLTPDGARVFSKSIEKQQGEKINVIFTKNTDVDVLWKKIKAFDANRSKTISHEEWNTFCEDTEHVLVGKNAVFAEMAISYPDCIYKRDLYEWVTNNQSQKAFALLDQYYPLHDAIEAYKGPNVLWKEENIFMFCANREEFYKPNTKRDGYNKVLNHQGMTVWMIAVSQRLPMKYLQYLKVKEDQFTVEDMGGENFIVNLINPFQNDRDNFYQTEVISYLAPKIPLWELFKLTFASYIEMDRNDAREGEDYRDLMKYCIELYFDDTFIEQVDSKAFRYRDLFNEESFESYGYDSWIDFLEDTNFMSWDDIGPMRVGQHMSQTVIEWYLREYKYEKKMMIGMIQGVTQRADPTEQVLILLECFAADTQMIIDAIKIMFLKVKVEYEKEGIKKELMHLVKSHLEDQFVEAFKKRVPKNALVLHFDDKFISELEQYFDYRNLFRSEKLASYGSKDFEQLIQRHNLDDPSLAIHSSLGEEISGMAMTAPEAQKAMARFVASTFEPGVIRWFLQKNPDQADLVGEVIWKERTDGRNLEVLLDSMKPEDIIRAVKGEKDLEAKLEKLCEECLPSETLTFFFHDEFCRKLPETDFRKVVLPYIHNWPEFIQIFHLPIHSSKLRHEVFREKERRFMTEEYSKNRLKGLKKRWYIIREMCDFVNGLENSLTIMVNDFYLVMKSRNVLTKEQFQLLFPPALEDIKAFLTTLNSHLAPIKLRLNESRDGVPGIQPNANFWLETTDISDIFEPFVRAYADTFYQYYIDYPERYDLCSALCNKDRSEYNEAAREILIPEVDFNASTKPKRYGDMVSIPFQVGTRFQSVIERIAKATPKDHLEYHRIWKLFKAMVHQNTLINERQKAAEGVT